MSRDLLAVVESEGEGLTWFVARRVRGEAQAVAAGRCEAPAVAGVVPAGGADPRAVALAAALRPHRVRDVVLGLGGGELLLRVVHLPPTDDSAELAGMVELQLDKHSPFPMESLILSHEVLERTDSGQKVLVAAVRVVAVEAAGALVRAAGLRPVAVDVALLGRWHSLRSELEREAGVGRRLCLIFEDGRCDLVAVDGGVPAAFRSLGPVEALTAADYADEVRYTFSMLDVEHGARPAGGALLWHDEAGVEAARRAAEALDGRAELRPLAGLPTRAEGLARRAFGAGAGGIDLVPPAWRAATASRALQRRLWGATAAALAIWLVVLSTVFVLRERARADLAARTAYLESVRAPADEVRRVRARVNALDRLRLETLGLDCLLDITRALPEGVELRSYHYTRERVLLAGQGTTATLVYDFKTRLDETPRFRAVELQGPVLQQGVETFRMTLDLREDEA